MNALAWVKAFVARWPRSKAIAVLGPAVYAELESDKPEARPDPTVNLDGKPKRKRAKRKVRK